MQFLSKSTPVPSSAQVSLTTSLPIPVMYLKPLQFQHGFCCWISEAQEVFYLILQCNVQNRIEGLNKSKVISSWIVNLPERHTVQSLYVLYHYMHIIVTEIYAHIKDDLPWTSMHEKNAVPCIQNHATQPYLLICTIHQCWSLISVSFTYLNPYSSWYTE